jgi:hypothetical protein
MRYLECVKIIQINFGVSIMTFTGVGASSPKSAINIIKINHKEDVDVNLKKQYASFTRP